MFGHLLFFKENNVFDLIEMFKMRSANTPQLAKSCSSTPCTSTACYLVTSTCNKSNC